MFTALNKSSSLSLKAMLNDRHEFQIGHTMYKSLDHNKRNMFLDFTASTTMISEKYPEGGISRSCSTDLMRPTKT